MRQARFCATGSPAPACGRLSIRPRALSAAPACSARLACASVAAFQPAEDDPLPEAPGAGWAAAAAVHAPASRTAVSQNAMVENLFTINPYGQTLSSPRPLPLNFYR